MVTLESPRLEPSEAIRRKLADEGRPVLLSFSMGKDSLAAWVALREVGVEVVPFYMMFVPGLRFIEHQLVHYERFFGTQILRVVHPTFWHYLDTLTFQPFHRRDIIDWLWPSRYTYFETQQSVMSSLDLPPSLWTVTGVRAADSINRRTALRQYGAWNTKEQKVAAIWDWDKADLVAALNRGKVKLPIDYRLFGRSFDGIDHRFIWPIRKHFPQDYELIKFYFPLIDLEFARGEVAKTHGQAK